MVDASPPRSRSRSPSRWMPTRAAVLRSGQRVLLRPISPADREPLRDGFRRLSIDSRLRRFLAPLDALTEEQLHYLTEVDYRRHMAWVAADAERPDVGLGVARYIKLEEEPDVAEVAVAVVDSHQGQGLGTLLLCALEHSAARNGVRRFRAFVSEENKTVMRLVRALHATTRREPDGLLRAEAPIPLVYLPAAFRAATRQLPRLGLRLLESPLARAWYRQSSSR